MTTTTNERTLIEVRDAVWVRGGRRVVDGATMRVASGAFTAIVGPNGAGKTSLMSLMAGLESPTSGELRWRDSPLHALDRSELARRRAWVEQHAALTAPFSVEEVVELGGVVVGATPRGVLRALDRVDMLDRRAQRYPTLSGGERQRVQLARALVQLRVFDDDSALDDRVLFLDEPTASLDPGATVRVLRLVRELVDRRGLTVVAVLHDLNEASAVADELALMADGAVAVYGPLRDVFVPARFESVYGCAFQRVARADGLPLLVPALGPDDAFAADDRSAHVERGMPSPT